MIFGRFAVFAGSVKIAPVAWTRQAASRTFEAFYRRQGLGDATARALEIKFGDGDPGVRFPGQRLQSALSSRQRNLEKRFRLCSRLPSISPRHPEFRKARFGAASTGTNQRPRASGRCHL
jgi:hypothetical protein